MDRHRDRDLSVPKDLHDHPGMHVPVDQAVFAREDQAKPRPHPGIFDRLPIGVLLDGPPASTRRPRSRGPEGRRPMTRSWSHDAAAPGEPAAPARRSTLAVGPGRRRPTPGRHLTLCADPSPGSAPTPRGTDPGQPGRFQEPPRLITRPCLRVRPLGTLTGHGVPLPLNRHRFPSEGRPCATTRMQLLAAIGHQERLG